MNYEQKYRQYYDQSASCRSSELTTLEQERIKKTCSLIPKEVKTILDVACGDGRITNIIAEKYDLVGIDISQNGLKSVRAKKICGSSSYLPFHDNLFDLVLSTELLEHLPVHLFMKTIKEVERVTQKYILISVPNKNCLQHEFVKCKKCKKIFNILGHLNSFSLRKLQDIFQNSKLRSYFFYGPLYNYYNPILLLIKQRIATSWVECEAAICPECGYRFKSQANRNIISMGCNFINKGFQEVLRRKTWIIALFEKREDLIKR